MILKRKFAVLVILTLAIASALAEKDCPLGLTDDPAPGQCGRYVDANGDNICDRSQELSQSGGASTGGQDIVQNEEQPTAEGPAERGSGTDTSNEPEITPDTETSRTSEYIEETETPSANHEPALSPPEPISVSGGTTESKGPDYHQWLWLLTITVLAVAGEFWQKKDPGKIVLIQTFWNWLLLAGFLASSLTGIYFILPPASRPAVHFNLSYWHTVTGLIFIYTGLYHAVRRATCLIRGPKNCIKKNPCC